MQALSDRTFHSYQPAQGHRLAHDPLNAIVGPRPIGWISTVNAAGTANLAPYSFFNLFSYRPPIIGFCSTGAKDSLANARATGEFVWNLVSRDLAEAMNQSAAEVHGGIDEFDLAGLEKRASVNVRPPRVAASAVQFECRVTQIVQLQDIDARPIESWLVLGEAVHIHIDPAHIVAGVYQTSSPIPIMRGGGPVDYFEITEDRRFEKARPRPPAGMER
jgi:flavin reductase (DIM6/NTAB) family NADH-FMN oxidoreductase RutF